MSDKYIYVIRAIDLPFVRESSIYENVSSFDKDKLIKWVKNDLEENVFIRKCSMKENKDGFLMIDDCPKEWLRIEKLKVL